MVGKFAKTFTATLQKTDASNICSKLLCLLTDKAAKLCGSLQHGRLHEPDCARPHTQHWYLALQLADLAGQLEALQSLMHWGTESGVHEQWRQRCL